MSRVHRVARARLARAANSIELLETRRLLACDVDVFGGDTLVVRGDKGNNVISIVEENDVVTVTCDGETETIGGGAGIEKVIVKGDRGDDEITVAWENEDGSLDQVSIDGSSGDDEISLTVGAVNGMGPVGELTTSHSGRYEGREDDLEIDVTGGSGDDDISVEVALFRGVGPVTVASEQGDDDEHEGLELDIDGGSGEDTIEAAVLVVNGPVNGNNDTLTSQSDRGRSGADGGDGVGNVDIEIDGGSNDDDISLDVLVVNARPFLPISASGSGGHHRGGGNEEDLEIDIDGGSGNDSIAVGIRVLNEGILNGTSGVAATAEAIGGGGIAASQASPEFSEVDLDLDIDGGSGNDEIDVEVLTTPTSGVILNPAGEINGNAPAFSDVEISVDGESGHDDIDVVVTALLNGVITDSSVGPELGLPLNIELEGGSGNDDVALRINANGAQLVASEGHKSFVRLEGESGDDELTLIVLGVVNGNLDDAFLIHGGSGFDTCITNVPEEALKEISCEDHQVPI